MLDFATLFVPNYCSFYPGIRFLKLYFVFPTEVATACSKRGPSRLKRGLVPVIQLNLPQTDVEKAMNSLDLGKSLHPNPS